MTINCKGNLIDLTTPKVMGILNITPDSFFDGGKYKDQSALLHQVEKMLNEGATFIDVGAYSSRPGAAEVSAEEELRRILPVIELILKKFPALNISIDTFRSTIAKNCLEAGGAIINDISAGKLDDKMFATVAKYKAPYIMMHMQGTPQTIHKHTDYNNLLEEMVYYFSERIATARNFGICDIIIDPGFGFSKTLIQNFQVLKDLNLLQSFNIPILAGLSRKSMIYKTLHTEPQYALNGTTALNIIALTKGASILRVHDVKEAVECIKLYQQLG